MGSLEYWFGTGDCPPTVWSSAADVDVDGVGGFDAVRLDFDGDGLTDDAMWDCDGDGAADRAVLDLGDPAVRYFADPARDGVWGREVARDSPAERTQPQIGERFAHPDQPKPGSVRWMSLDYDGDGAVDDASADLDGNGTHDVVLLSIRDRLRHDTVLVAEEEQGRMTVRLSDTDGDGRLETVRRGVQP
ncbi:hypothetical protein ERC79_11380 [Rhodococcus sp. ABRD24]|uniref:hypothetical protein n=1 Tax=Rhodococcus sp. ABRD24 TaxID=2507582 RepID=UPI00103D872F|nr:hypothetical protein [Rhodococcus sp. ABRD24]QBJ96492.1 hypothetical protein ERC79_11380 [Rhodococcus sp. ABRD24]